MPSLPPRRLWTTPLESCDMIAKGCLERYSCFYWHCQGLGKPIPELNGKLTGMAFQVPTHSVSIAGLTCCLEKATKYDNLNKLMRQALEGPSRESLATLRTKLSPATLTVTLSLLPLIQVLNQVLDQVLLVTLLCQTYFLV